MSASGSSSLRPAWSKGSSGGRGGFQPPPTVSERGDKARSGSWGSQERNSTNKFAVLDEDDDGPLPGAPGLAKPEDKPAGNSRSEAFRSSFGGRSSSTGNKPPGRSLADLAARVPEPPGGVARRAQSGGGRFPNVRAPSDTANGTDGYKPDPKVIRFTREKLLSMRPVPKDMGLPDLLQELEGTPIVSTAPQDPVCWDTFDSEEIWETVRERSMARAAKNEPVAGGPRLPEATADPRRRSTVSGGGRWQRGVALPPPEEAARKRNDNAENPDELWDDPVGGATGAASDFSSFGAMPDDEPFDFDKMAEATKKLDEEIHGSARFSDSADDDVDDQVRLQKAVDTTRPLASAGTAITSGSGNDVNVFEDFDSPSADQPNEGETPVVRGATEDPTASSRLMKMIGVEPPKPEGAAADGTTAGGNPWGGGNPAAAQSEPSVPGIDPIFGSIGGLSLNPWGGAPGTAAPNGQDGGLDLAGRLGALAAEQVEMEKRAQQEAELLRRRQDEEVQRRALAQRQAEQQARQQQAQAAAMQQQQQASQQSQVELVLMERICSILENSWGRSDLVSILTTLHSEDSRVIPLLSNVDALRALVARSPQRVALRRDPSFSGDMAVLLVTNTQWQQQQQQQAQARQQEEELRRRRLEEEARAQAQSRASIQIKADLPWFYSDPQNNIQGPFRGEEMRQWLEAGYFKGDLPISQQTTGPFVPLSALFPDLNHAFKVPQANIAVDEAERKALEEEKRLREKAEDERRASEARIVAEREAERQAAEAQAAAAEADKRAMKDSNDGNEPSTQLKMMLGLSGAQSAGVVVEADKAAPSAPAPKKQSADKKASKASKKSQSKTSEEAPVPKAPAPTKPAATAWGGAASAKPKKSISEIQQEEARKAALMAAQGDDAPRQSSSGWANVAAGTQGWSSGVVKKTVATAPTAVAANIRPSQTTRQPSGAQPSSAPVNKAPPLSQQQRSSSSASASTPAEEFGATLSPALENWCKEQMEKLTGSDDLTLIGFCMTLTDASEIRQYLQAYLGNGAKVNSFASEFIIKRGLGGNEQEEWETPGSAKKGRKKKTGSR